jgi:hypothetical protein
MDSVYLPDKLHTKNTVYEAGNLPSQRLSASAFHGNAENL